MPEQIIKDGDIAARVQFFLESHSAEYEEGHLVLVTHAAFPPVITPDLMYQLWANFKNYRGLDGRAKTIPIWAVADVLLGSFFRQTGRELYEMQHELRTYLVNRLKEDPRFGEERMLELAGFLYQYSQARPQTQEWENFNQVLEWTAYMTANPEKAAGAVVGALRDSLREKTAYSSIGIVNLIGNMLREGGEGAGVGEGVSQLAKNLKSLIVDKDEGPAHTLEIKLPAFLKEKLEKITGGDGVRPVAPEAPDARDATVTPAHKPPTLAEGTMAMHSLLIGVVSPEYYDRGDSGAEVEFAAKQMATTLTAPWLLPMATQRILVGSAATRAALKEELLALLAAAAPESVVFIYFAGSISVSHDSFLVLYDYGTGTENGVVSSTELQSWLSPYKDLTIILLIEGVTSNRNWLGTGDRNVQLSYRPVAASRGENAHQQILTAQLHTIIVEASPPLTYRDVYRQLLGRIAKTESWELPFFDLTEDNWDSYIFTSGQGRDDLRREQLRDLGYPLPAELGQNRRLPRTLAGFCQDIGVVDFKQAPHYLRLAWEMRMEKAVRILVVGDRDAGGLVPFFTVPGSMSCRFVDGFAARAQSKPQVTPGYYIDLLSTVDVVVIDHKALDYETFDMEGRTYIVPEDFLSMLVPMAWALGKELMALNREGSRLNQSILAVVDRYGIRVIDAGEAALEPTSMGQSDSSLQSNTALLEYRDFLRGLVGFRKRVEFKGPITKWLQEVLGQALYSNVLSITQKNLKTILPQVFELSELEELYLDHNEIRAIDPAIAQLGELRVLDLSYNPLDQLPAELLELKELENLDLSNTKLGSLPLDIDRLSALRELHVHGIPLRMLPVALTRLPALEILDAGGGRILNVPGSIINSESPAESLRAYATSRWQKKQPDKNVLLFIGMGKGLPEALSKRAKEVAQEMGCGYGWHPGIQQPEELFAILQSETGVRNFIYIRDEKGLLYDWLLPKGGGPAKKGKVNRKKKDFGLMLSRFFNYLEGDGFFHLIYDGLELDDNSFKGELEDPRISSIIWHRSTRLMSDKFLLLFYEALLSGMPFRQCYTKATIDVGSESPRVSYSINYYRPAPERQSSTLGESLFQGDPQVLARQLIDRMQGDLQLDLSGLGLKTWPAELFNIPILRSLDISDNPLTEIPPGIARFISLQQLRCRNTLIRRIPDEFFGLHQLMYLDLDGTDIRVVPSELSGLRMLQTSWLPYEKLLNVSIDFPNIDRFLDSLRVRRRKDAGSKPFVLKVDARDPGILFDKYDNILTGAAQKKGYVYVPENGVLDLRGLAAQIRRMDSDNNLLVILDDEGRLAVQFGSGRDKDDLVFDYFSSFGQRLNLVYVGPLNGGTAFSNLVLAGKINFVLTDLPFPGNAPDRFLNLLLEGISCLEALQNIDRAGRGPNPSSFPEEDVAGPKGDGSPTHGIHYNAQQFADFYLKGHATVAAKKKAAPKKPAPKKAAPKKKAAKKAAKKK